MTLLELNDVIAQDNPKWSTSDPGTYARFGRPNLFFSAARRQPKVGTDQATKIQDVDNKGR